MLFFPLVVFGGVHVAYLLSFLYCVGIFAFLFVVFGLFCFDCHRLVSCVASVASVSGLSILDHLLQFPLTFIRKTTNTTKICHCISWQCKETMRRQF